MYWFQLLSFYRYPVSSVVYFFLLLFLLKDSFEDDKSKILMILCASPDPKEIHKTISTLEYGAKAKCIVRGRHTPVKDGGEDSSSAVILGSRIAVMDEFILKLQKENKLREKEKNEAHKQLLKKEEEVAALRAKLENVEGKGSAINEEEINMKVNERTQILKLELEKKLEECQKMAHEFVELERRRMEERILQQQQEVEMLRQRLEQIELELRSKDGNDVAVMKSMEGSGFAKKLLGLYGCDDATVKSMDLDMDDPEPFVREVKLVGAIDNGSQSLYQPHLSALNGALDNELFAPTFGDKLGLSTVYEEEEVEEEEEEEEPKGNGEDEEEVEKEIIEEKRICVVDGFKPNAISLAYLHDENSENTPIPEEEEYFKGRTEDKFASLGLKSVPQDDKDSASNRRVRIQNIFTLCGNQRELSKHIKTPVSAKKMSENIDPQVSSLS